MEAGESEKEQWLAEQWEERERHMAELRKLLVAMGSTLDFEKLEAAKQREYEMWRVRMTNSWNFMQLPKEEQDRRVEAQIRQIKERRAREKALRDN